MVKRIYLAGPEVFLPDSELIAEKKKAICRRFGFEGLFPTDTDREDARPGEAAAERTPETGQRISQDNEALIRTCDLLIANMTPFRGPSMDVGTAYEMGFMRALGRPVLGYSNVTSNLRDRTVELYGGRREKSDWVDEYGLTIEDFGLGDNLMLDGAVLARDFKIIRTDTLEGERFESLTAFEECVREASQRIGDLGEQAPAKRRVHYEARAWTWGTIGRELASFERVRRRDWRQAVNIIGRHLEGLYILRVPLLTLLFLFVLPFVALGGGRALLENLFVDLGAGGVFVTTLVTFLTAASAVAVINAILVNGHERFPWLALGRYYGGPFHWLCFIAPAPLVRAVVRHGRDGWLGGWLAAGAGVATGLIVLSWIRIEQAARSREIQQWEPTWKSRPLVYPHRLPFDDPIEGSEPKAIWLRLPFVVLGHVASLVHRLRRGMSRTLWWLVGMLPNRLKQWIRVAAAWVGGFLKSGVPVEGLIYVPEPDKGQRPFYSAPHYLLLLSLVLFTVWVGFWITFYQVGNFALPTLAYTVFTVWVGCLIVSAVTFVLDRYRIPLLTLLVGWAALGSWVVPNDHYYETLRTPIIESDAGLEPAAIIDARSGRPLILVAAAGGGIQAAAWTARVLAGLQQALPSFGEATALLSGVSGGAVGIYHFADAYDAGRLTPARVSRAFDSAAASSLEDVAWGLAAIDLPRAFVPFSLPFPLAHPDRGWALGRALDRRSSAPGALLSQWESDVRALRRPAVIFNATLVESGRPLLLGTTRLPNRRDVPASYDAADFRSLRLITSRQAPAAPDVPIATAVRLSATFPFVTPVATSTVRGPIELSQHVADGGYYDNFAMMSLMSWLDDGLRAADQPPRQVLVLQIRSFPESASREREAARGALFQTYAPLTTLTSVRTAAQQLRNEQELEYLRRYWERAARPVAIVPIAADFSLDRDYADQEPPLSWRLNDDQLDAIERAWDNLRDKVVARVREFLTPPAPQAATAP